jgi:hypothetical protein
MSDRLERSLERLPGASPPAELVPRILTLLAHERQRAQRRRRLIQALHAVAFLAGLLMLWGQGSALGDVVPVLSLMQAGEWALSALKSPVEAWSGLLAAGVGWFLEVGETMELGFLIAFVLLVAPAASLLVSSLQTAGTQRSAAA